MQFAGLGQGSATDCAGHVTRDVAHNSKTGNGKARGAKLAALSHALARPATFEKHSVRINHEPQLLENKTQSTKFDTKIRSPFL